MALYNTRLWLFLEDYVYYQPPRPRVRPKDRPMQVICVGPPRSATESLQHALLKLGYEHTYHGWDVFFEEAHNMRGWAKLARRKFLGTADSGGDCEITAAEFDALLGHAVAVCDVPASAFAAEIIKAYPEAKVIINKRSNLESWHASIEKNIVATEHSWVLYLASWFQKDFFWAWTTGQRIVFPGLFRCMGQSLDLGIMGNGKWVYREHCAMVKGLVREEGRLLEWSVEEGWEPLCSFLGKDVPAEPFPHVNLAAGFHDRVDRETRAWMLGAVRNFTIGVALVAITVTLAWKVSAFGSAE
ncbi:uncharacterized protein LTR77_004669 [Saxophila tyrrhenica]|uniref:P-loop containing nucleoside triphosphate hydrolase protein n=1 Tax=Saxophila tyrrhenica TaxID=1690608 RepID=A0AAV9PDV7_9PEZI|nr:hypothetical protein LTR77_004669 [Saxophila tyrrhenica]